MSSVLEMNVSSSPAVPPAALLHAAAGALLFSLLKVFVQQKKQPKDLER